MCKEHKIAKSIIDEKVNGSEPFSFSEITQAILKEGGILRVASGTTIGEYLMQLEDNGIIKFIPKENRFRLSEASL